MSEVIESVEVSVPIRTAYNQWTEFTEFPLFMEGVEEEGLVENLGDKLGLVKHRAVGDMERFKDFIESREVGPKV